MATKDERDRPVSDFEMWVASRIAAVCEHELDYFEVASEIAEKAVGIFSSAISSSRTTFTSLARIRDDEDAK